MGQARLSRGRVIEAEKFVLRDSAERERAELFILDDGSPGLYLLRIWRVVAVEVRHDLDKPEPVVLYQAACVSTCSMTRRG
jgi:hypothetical protein